MSPPLSPDDLRRAYAAVDATLAGRAVFEDLAARFGALPVVTSGGMDAVLKTYHNTGARSVVEHIDRMLTPVAAARQAAEAVAVASFDFPPDPE